MPFVSAMLILGVYQYVLMYTGQTLFGAQPQPNQNLSGIIDPLIFSTKHIYLQGKAGYDPEGLLTMVSALISAFFGYTAGMFLRKNKTGEAFTRILFLAALLLVLTPLLANFIPVNKRLWTPSFVTLTSGWTLMVLAFSQLRWDARIPILEKIRAPFYWIFEGIGRNAILLYFGPSILMALLRQWRLPPGEEGQTAVQILYGWVGTWSVNPQLAFIAIYGGVWALLASLLHWRRWYLTL